MAARESKPAAATTDPISQHNRSSSQKPSNQEIQKSSDHKNPKNDAGKGSEVVSGKPGAQGTSSVDAGTKKEIEIKGEPAASAAGVTEETSEKKESKGVIIEKSSTKKKENGGADVPDSPNGCCAPEKNGKRSLLTSGSTKEAKNDLRSERIAGKTTAAATASKENEKNRPVSRSSHAGLQEKKEKAGGSETTRISNFKNNKIFKNHRGWNEEPNKRI